MSRSVFGVVKNLIEDKTESEQTDFENPCPAFVLMIPIQLEAEGLRIEGKRGFGVINKEDASRIEVIHGASYEFSNIRASARIQNPITTMLSRRRLVLAALS